MDDSTERTTHPVSTMPRDRLGEAHSAAAPGAAQVIAPTGNPAETPAGSPAGTTAGKPAEEPAAVPPRIPGVVGYGLLGVAYLGLLVADSTASVPAALPFVDVLLVIAAFTLTQSALGRLLTPGSLSPFPRLLVLVKQYGAALLLVLGAALGTAWLFGGLDTAAALQRQLPAALVQGSDWARYSTAHVLPAVTLGSSQSPWPFAVLWPLSVIGQYALLWPLLLTLLMVVLRRSIPALGALLLLVTAAPVAAVALLPSTSLPALLRSPLGLAGGERLLDLTGGAAAACLALAVSRRRAAREQAPGTGTGTERSRGRRITGVVLWTAAELLVLAAGVAAWCAGQPGSWAPVLRAFGVAPDAIPPHHLYDGADLRGLAVHPLIVAAVVLVLALGGGLISSWLRRPLLVEIGRIGYLLALVGALMMWLLHRGWPHLPWYGLLAVGIGLGWLLTLCVYYPTSRLALRPWRALRALPLLLAGCLVLGAGSWQLPAHAAAMLRPGGRPLVLGLGDQLTGDLALALNRNRGSFAGRSGVRTGPGPAADCGLMACPGWPEQWQSALQSTRPDLVVLHLGRDASQYAGTDPKANTCTAAYRSEYLGLLQQAVTVVHRTDPGVPVLLANERLDNSAAEPIQTACYNQRIKEFTDAHRGSVFLLDLNAELCPSGACRQATPQGDAFYATVDGTRISPAGRALIAPWLERQLTADR